MEEPSRSHPRLVLSRAIGDRVLLGAFSLMLGVFLGFISLAFHQYQPASTGEDVFLHLVFEAFFTLAIFALLGLLWAALAPRWLERALQSTARKVWLAISVLAAATVCTVLYFAFVG